jgi:hypothetical protein
LSALALASMARVADSAMAATRREILDTGLASVGGAVVERG